MNNVKLSKVDNGYIVEITKFDFATKRPELEVFVYKTLDEAVNAIKEKF